MKLSRYWLIYKVLENVLLNLLYSKSMLLSRQVFSFSTESYEKEKNLEMSELDN